MAPDMGDKVDAIYRDVCDLRERFSAHESLAEYQRGDFCSLKESLKEIQADSSQIKAQLEGLKVRVSFVSSAFGALSGAIAAGIASVKSIIGGG
jgi:hypothetical protein